MDQDAAREVGDVRAPRRRGDRRAESRGRRERLAANGLCTCCGGACPLGYRTCGCTNVWPGRNSPERIAQSKTRGLVKQRASIQGAKSHRSPWTPAEDVVIEDPELTVEMMSQMLGRTFFAVQSRRRALGAARRVTPHGPGRRKGLPGLERVP